MTSSGERRQAPRARERARAQRGQALAMLLMLLAALIGGLLFVFNSGQIVAAKVRLLGAADAAAYSAATWEARSLNFQAYMNRAIVANEVAVAQLVSLRSWSTYMKQVLQEAATVSTVIPPLGAPMHTLARSWNTLDRGLQRALPPLEMAASRWNSEVLARAESYAQAQAGPAAMDLAARVAAANEPESRLSGSGQALASASLGRWQRFTTSYRRTGDERARLKQVVLDSRDGFTRSRGWSIGHSPLPSLAKRGGTELIGYDAWRGMDTLSLHVPGFFGSHEQPLAWGAAGNQRYASAGRADYGGSYRDNPRASREAAAELDARRGYAGLPGYRDLLPTRGGATEVLRYELELRQPGAAIATSDRVMGAPATVVPGEQPKVVAPAYAGDGAYALAAARVQFMRPIGRSDQREELPSLFNPYWQARLAPVSRQQRVLAAAGKAAASDPYAVLP